MAGHQEAERGGDNLRIDESERKSWASIAFIRAGGMFSAPTLMVGAALGLGLALSGAALATLAGFGFIVAYMCFVSMQASDLGLPTASLAAPALGRAGARYIVSLIVGIVTIGWFGVQTAVCGASLALMLADVFGLAVPVWACSTALALRARARTPCCRAWSASSPRRSWRCSPARRWPSSPAKATSPSS